MKILISIIILTLALTSCKNEATKQAEALINEDLNSRFTGFEVVEIRKDSSFIYWAKNILMSLQLRVSNNNLEIIKTISNFESGNFKMKGLQVYQYIDSLFRDSEKRLRDFEDRRYDRSDPCYYVKYRIFAGANKIEQGEYFLIREYGDNKKEVLRRPVDWDEFMREEKYNQLIDEALTFYGDILDYKYKYAGKY